MQYNLICRPSGVMTHRLRTIEMTLQTLSELDPRIKRKELTP